ncbi:MAG: AMP-binding protein [Acidimicrobiales bacterium]
MPTVISAADMIRSRMHDDSCGLLFEGATWSWDDVTREMLGRVPWIRSSTEGRQPHVGVLLDNVPEYLFVLGGCLLSGAVVVGLNSTRRGGELAADIVHTDCAVVVTDSDHRPLIDELDLGDVAIVDVKECSGHRRISPDYEDRWTAEPRPADLALLLFTAGSTGGPKAVRVSHRRVAESAVGSAFSRSDVLYCAMPLFHGNALFSSVFPAMGSGATIALRRRFSASACMPDIRNTGATFFSTVGRALSFILATPPDAEDGDHRLRVVLAPESSARDAAAFEERFGCRVLSGYGSSENAIVFVPRPGLPPEALGAPIDGLDVAVVSPTSGEECERAHFDSSGRLVNPDSAIGEIVGRNALDRFEGYYNNVRAERSRSRNGWYWSGDLGYRDEQGVFYFAGRTVDWIRVDGENFAAAPLERLFGRFEGLTGVVVFGVPDEQTVDDQVMAVVEVRDPVAFDPVGFDAFLSEQPDLGTKWSPRYVLVTDSLPVGPTNKLDRQKLKSEGFWSGGLVFWRPGRAGPMVQMTDDDRVAVAPPSPVATSAEDAS